MESQVENAPRSAQVCDQCRKRKTKCDGVLPACSHCSSLNTVCQFSAILKRRTKRRGHDPKDETIRSLQNEIETLRQQLKAQENAVPDVVRESADVGTPQPATLVHATAPSSRNYVKAARRSRNDTLKSMEKGTNPVFRHLGRLICPEDGVDQFAGSSTGVHFTLSAQTTYQSKFSSHESFPESVFSLYLLSPSLNNLRTGQSSWKQPLPHLFEILSETKSYYIGAVKEYFDTWFFICPVLTRKQFLLDIDRIFLVRDSTDPNIQAETPEEPVFYQLLVILAIIKCGVTTEITKVSEYLSYASRLHEKVTSIGNIGSLQALLLLLVFYQITAQHHLIHSTIGSAVRIAQSLGLHRHHRRFRFGVGETELRKRLWWCTYIFDVTTSLHYGLPKLISDDDDDNDLPADCDFDDSTITQLPFPFPGETTQISPFICYIKLARILSHVLKELYTTTRRRNGVEKIEQLTRELQIWEASSEPIIGRFSDIIDHEESHMEGTFQNTFSNWLHIMAQMSQVYIHRPALTFEPTESQFKLSVRACGKSSIGVLCLLNSFHGDERILSFLPSSPNMIFQCALLCLYQMWNQPLLCDPTSPSSVDTAGEELTDHEEWVGIAISMLDQMSTKDFSGRRMNHQETTSRILPLVQASGTLRHVLKATIHGLSHHSDNVVADLNDLNTQGRLLNQSRISVGTDTGNYTSNSVSSSTALPAPTVEPFDLDAAMSDESLYGNGHNLDFLNQLDESTWAFLNEIRGYSGDASDAFMSFH